MENDFVHACAPAEEWRVIPLAVRKGSLPMEPCTGLGVVGQLTFATSIAFMYAREHLDQADLDATIACISRRSTIIARIRIKGARIGVEEALDAPHWREKLARIGGLGSASKSERAGGQMMSGGTTE